MSWASERGASSLPTPRRRGSSRWSTTARHVKRAYRRRVPPEVLAMVTAANTKAAVTGASATPRCWCCSRARRMSPSGGLPDDADLLVTVRASTLRHHAGPGRIPGWGGRPGRRRPGVHRRCARPARKPVSTPADCSRWHTGADVHPAVGLPRRAGAGVLAGSRAGRASSTESKRRSSRGSRSRAFINPGEPDHGRTARRTPAAFAGPAFLLNQMLVWGFTGQVISAMLDVAGWAQPWRHRRRPRTRRRQWRSSGGTSDYGRWPNNDIVSVA